MNAKDYADVMKEIKDLESRSYVLGDNLWTKLWVGRKKAGALSKDENYALDFAIDAMQGLGFIRETLEKLKDPRDNPTRDNLSRPKKLVRNRIKCLKCGDIIESKSVHDFVECSCGACSTDGGTDYMQISGNAGDWEDMSEWEDVDE